MQAHTQRIFTICMCAKRTWNAPMRRFIFPASSRHIWITELSRFIYLFIHQKMVENPRVTDEQNGSVITEDEAALYDRQIRLWGLDAQKRLEISNVSSCRKDSFKPIFESFCTVCWWKFQQNYVNSMLNIKMNILIWSFTYLYCFVFCVFCVLKTRPFY